jgi:hypothetical protein
MKYPAFCHYCGDGICWFRVYGYGLCYADRDKYPPLFSERNGLVWYVRVGRHSIKILRP